jgi:diaminohydroxyphosphoribosylaminopyrimidine deaminase/5-amino-6-(5-phosphoribosylamino)uracil reductase
MHNRLDREMMARALRLARRGLYTTRPNPRVGCVLVRDGDIVGEGWHERAGGPHAEAVALQQAGARARGATAYVTLEPCCHHGRTPPCTDALLSVGVRRVVAAMTDPNPQVAGAGLRQLHAAGVEVESGLMSAEAEALNAGFILRHRAGRPYVRAKLAMTLDGRTAAADGRSQWITGSAARRDVQHLRARSCAILTGIGTVLADDPSLTLRPDELELAELARHVDRRIIAPPLRVVVDSRFRIPVDARLLAAPGRVLIATADDRSARTALAGKDNVEHGCFPGAGGRVDLAGLLAGLAQRQVNEVLLEAGAVLSGAMLQAGLIDEMVIYVAPKLLGDQGRALFDLRQVLDLDRAVPLVIEDVRAVGEDWRITARLRPPSGDR